MADFVTQNQPTLISRKILVTENSVISTRTIFKFEKCSLASKIPYQSVFVLKLDNFVELLLTMMS